MNNYEISLLILSLFMAFAYAIAVYLCYQYDKYKRLYIKTSITADDADFILSIIQYNHSHKKPCEQLSPRTVALYNKCYNIKEFYDKEK